MSDLKISIIVPVYKVEKYLDQCILSIINQSYKNLEVILINDGSPDKCKHICDKYSKQDKRIKVIHKENEGLSAARNTGLEIATGEFIGFVDSDDWIHKKMYEVLIAAAIEEDTDIVECKFINIYNRNNKEVDNDSREKRTFTNIQSLQNHLNGRYFYRCVWPKIYKKHLFDEIRFPIGKLAEDLFVTHEVLYKAKKVTHVDFTGYFYYIRPESIMGQKNYKLITATLEGMIEQHKFICENVPELKKTIDHLYFNCLLKSYAFFSTMQENKDASKYMNFIVNELNRKDIVVNGMSKYAFMLFKTFPFIFVALISLLEKRSR